MPHRHYIFVAFVCGVLWGVAVAMWVPVAWVLSALLGTGLVFIIVLAGISQARQIGVFWLLVAVVVGMSLGAWQAMTKLHWLTSPENLIGQEVSWSGVIISEPQETRRGINATVSFRDCDLRKLDKDADLSNLSSNTDNANCAGGRALVTFAPYSELRLRDGVSARCKFKEPENFGDFDWRMYLAKNGVRAICAVDEFQSIELTTFWDKSYAQLMKLRYLMEGHIAQSVPQPAGALAAGLLFGGDRRLSDEVADDFRRTGLTHIVAVSGFNVTVIAQFMVLFGIWIGLWRAQAVWLAICAVVIFVAMIGFPSPAVRAGIMGLMVLLVMRAGRVGSALPAVLAAAAAMALVNPMILRYDVGFQLSVLATLGLILMYPLFERWFMRRGEMKFFAEVFFMTLSAQIFVVPIIAYYFGSVSIVSLLANLLVLPVIPIAMVLAFLVAVIGFASSAAAVFAGGALYWLLEYVFAVVDVLAGLSWASKEVSMSVWLLGVFYLILFVGIVIARRYARQCNCAKK